MNHSMLAKLRARTAAAFDSLVSASDNSSLIDDKRLLSLALVLIASVFVFYTSLEMDLGSQMVFSLIVVLFALMIRRISSPVTRMILIFLSIVLSSRYLYWRITETFNEGNPIDYAFGFGLLVAEIYAFVILIFGYIQTIWPLNRRPQPLSADNRDWPTVDIFIPSYNEPLDVVKPTILAAMAIDWPAEKIKVYVLDDGRREDFREYCEAVGVVHLTRPDNKHAKAGNINAALKVTQGEFVAIFDCDHIPTRSFLQVVMGWFSGYPKLAMIQTPHHFFSPDPFEKNLKTFKKVPNEGELFYGLIQDGNDFWNASFFCGSCAVIRRTQLLEVGGIAVETVTEDAHTALKLHRKGYDTAYLAVPQAAGLATESLSGHVGQRIRWARGMAQIFRTDNPLLGKGLSFGQRVCYLNAMMHFFYGLPRIIFLTAPIAYLVFGAHVIHAAAIEIATYAIPFLILANTANSHIQGNYRHSFWNEVYETVLAWYILRPTLYALINPKAGGFNVTAKGGLIEKSYFDLKISGPYILILLLNLFGFIFGVWRLFNEQGDEFLTAIINMAWTGYNVLLLGASVLVARESIQRREHPRGQLDINVSVQTPDERAYSAKVLDFSMGGLGLEVEHQGRLQKEQSLFVVMPLNNRKFVLPVRVASVSGNRLGLQFHQLSIEQEKNLVNATFARADVWVDSWAVASRKLSLSSLWNIVQIGAFGNIYLLRKLPGWLWANIKFRVSSILKVKEKNAEIS
ncbi:UDP-forming cellulose synthase catalytic subunit [Limnobacter parvus]|uniref:Cellulose synthase catalytic subunit [UDP-forming] n=1 Tax=Limnobacter parvus TaxID=2939690 RepID=A0ABT1XLW8_9BURK|nr:UDP-forming cellulose synthase catalytic subunit [Limnobacter parvus]MCR2747879.1 UDP-forming cellulose synthase catalytic subunit [Limnobacter parvus]